MTTATTTPRNGSTSSNIIWSDRENFDFHGKYLDMKGIRGKPKPYGGTRPVIMNAGASATGQAFAVKNCDAFFMQASRTSLEETAQARAPGAGCGARAGPRNRLLYGGRRHLPADQEGSRGIFSSLHRRARRLVGGRQHFGAEENLAADRADGGISHPPQPIRPGQWRAADRRRSRSCRGASSPIWARPASPASPSRWSIISRSCRISATR